LNLGDLKRCPKWAISIGAITDWTPRELEIDLSEPNAGGLVDA
jgi:hypothetical protein